MDAMFCDWYLLVLIGPDGQRRAIVIHLNPSRPIDTHPESHESLWSIRTHQELFIPIIKHMSHTYRSGPIKAHQYPLWATGAILIYQKPSRSIDTHHEQQEPLWSNRHNNNISHGLRRHYDPPLTIKTHWHLFWAIWTIIIKQDPSRPIYYHQNPLTPIVSHMNHYK